MKSRLLLLTTLAAILSVACASPSSNSVPANYLGEPAWPFAATRTIVVEPGTRWVNVTGGDIVKFMAGGKTFAWNFDVADRLLQRRPANWVRLINPNPCAA
jgi:photosystem II stability/assembly factor-like uncharacterized protein